MYKLITDQNIGDGLEIVGGKLKTISTVDVKLDSARVEGNNLILTLSDSNEVTVDLGTLTNTDTKVSSIEVDSVSKEFVLHLSDNTEVRVPVKDIIAPYLGEEMQDLDGNVIGYLLARDAI